MESTSELIDLMIRKCIELFEQERRHDFPQNSISLGEPPKTAIIAYGFGEMKAMGYLITDIQKKWLYENGHLQETDIKREIDIEQRNGMYYLEARFDFAFDTDNHLAYLNVGYGPRYARGIRFELAQKEDGIFLCNEKILWVS